MLCPTKYVFVIFFRSRFCEHPVLGVVMAVFYSEVCLWACGGPGGARPAMVGPKRRETHNLYFFILSFILFLKGKEREEEER
jgi:hypothetical protein